MKIQPKEILIKDLYKGYKDNFDEGVVGYGGKLDIRPPYQREFVYGAKEIDTYNNNLKGQLPSELGLLTMLKTGFQVYNNEISGSLPSEVGSMTAMSSGF